MSEVIDNKANRIRVLKDIIKHLHAGNPPEQVQRQMQEIVRQTDAPLVRPRRRGSGTRKGQFLRDLPRTHRLAAPVP